MTTITIKQFGDKVFFLNGDGFKRGYVYSTHVSSGEGRPLTITYRVRIDGDRSEFGGYEKNPSEIWDTKEEMIKHFTEKTI